MNEELNKNHQDPKQPAVPDESSNADNSTTGGRSLSTDTGGYTGGTGSMDLYYSEAEKYEQALREAIETGRLSSY